MKYMRRIKEVDAIQLKLELCHPDGKPVPVGSWLVEDENGRQCLMEDERFRTQYTPIFEIPPRGKGLFDRISESYDRNHPPETRTPTEYGQAIVDDAGTRHFLHKSPPTWDSWARKFWNKNKRDDFGV
jgi:hypothetical protein